VLKSDTDVEHVLGSTFMKIVSESSSLPGNSVEFLKIQLIINPFFLYCSWYLLFFGVMKTLHQKPLVYFGIVLIMYCC
jgi:hypothetical protein